MLKKKRIGILTSGGDCPGLNAVIRAATRHAILNYGWEVWGIVSATQGLRERPPRAIPLGVHNMDIHGIDPLLQLGGTFLGTVSRGDPFDQLILEGYDLLQLDSLIAVGGDGSFQIFHQLVQAGGWKLVGIPKTIDNDVALTEQSVGFDTAVGTICESLDRLTSTAASHDRVMIVEVMGREAGHLALRAGLAGGADVILLPEIPFSLSGICAKIMEERNRWGRRCALIVVAEGIVLEEEPGDSPVLPPHQRGTGHALAKRITQCSDFDVRVTVLGHVQRGGMPSAFDRVIASAFGKAAVDLSAAEQFGCMVAWQGGQVVSVPLAEVVALSPTRVAPHASLLRTAQALGTYIGDGVDSYLQEQCAREIYR